MTVGELRRRLRADTPLPPPRPSDAAAAAAWTLAAVAWHAALALGELMAAWWVAREVGWCVAGAPGRTAQYCYRFRCINSMRFCTRTDERDSTRRQPWV